jgi:hypothetical protein
MNVGRQLLTLIRRIIGFSFAKKLFYKINHFIIPLIILHST